MNTDPTQFDELLSGMLDGVLSEEETRQLEQAMERDKSLQKRFEELESMRRMLLKHRPKGRLSADFAASVTRIARDRASVLESPPPWIIATESPVVSRAEFDSTSPASMSPASISTWRPVLYAIALGTAAVLGFVMFTTKTPDQNNIISQVPENPQASSNSPDVSVASAAELLADNSKETESQNSDRKIQVENGVSADSKLAVNPSSDISNNLVGSKESNETEAMDVGVSAESKTAIKNDTTRIVSNNPSTPENSMIATDKGNTLPLAANDVLLMMVVDLTIDAVAQENNALEAILEKHSIVFSDDLSISESQLKTLEDTRLVGKPNSKVDDKMNVYVLRASTLKIGTAITDMIEQYRDFPDFKIDLTTDKSSALLVRQLSGIQVAQDDSGIARRIRPPKEIGLTSFKSSNRASPLSMDREMLKKNKKFVTESLKADFEQQSTVLLLVRPAK